MEHPSHGAGFGQVSAILAHEVPKFADNAVAVRGHRFNQHPHAAGAIALEGHFFVLFTFELAGAAHEGSLDIFVWHVLVLARKYRGAQTRIGIRIATADSGSDGNFADYSSKDATALRVGSRLLMFNGGPF